MLLEETVAKGDVVTFNTPTPQYRSIVAVTRDDRGEINSMLVLYPMMDGCHGLEVFSPELLLTAIQERHPLLKTYTLQDVKNSLHDQRYPSVPALRIPLAGIGHERSLIDSISEQVADFKPELDYDDITVSLNYGGVWFRYVCDDNPEDAGDYADEDDVHKLLNCILTATIARQNTEPFIDRYSEWKLAMSNFVNELINGDGFKVRCDSKELAWFKKHIDNTTSFRDLRPNN